MDKKIIAKIKEKHSILSVLAGASVETNGKTFRAIWRNDKTASCSIFANGEKWKDHGSDAGGDCIDLYMLLYSCDLKTALRELNKGNVSSLPERQVSDTKGKGKNKVLNVLNFTREDTPQTEYAKGRSISYKVLKRYCKLVKLGFEKFGFGWYIGFENDSGGFELRRAATYINSKGEEKKNILPKIKTANDITTLNKGFDQLVLFEGFFNFLSCVELWPDLLRNRTVIVLNTVDNVSKVDFTKFAIVHSFLDNDKAGKTTLEKVKKTGVKTVDYAHAYKGKKDLNEALTQGKDMTYCMGSSKDLNERLIKGG